MVLLQSETKELQKGDSAPAFNLKNIDGKMVRLDQFEGKIVVVIFMCNHCPYVKLKMQEIAQLQNEYAAKGVVIIGINANDPTNYPDDDFSHMQAVAKQFGYRYYLVDEIQDIARAYGAVCTPDPFVFDTDHKLVYHGRINDAMQPTDKPTKHDLREVLDLVIAGKPVKDWFVPSMGCSIKWKMGT